MNKEMNKKAAHICWEFDFDPQTYLYLVVKNITAFFMTNYYSLNLKGYKITLITKY